MGLNLHLFREVMKCKQAYTQLPISIEVILSFHEVQFLGPFGSGLISFFVKSKDIYLPLITLIFADIVSAFIVRLSLRREPQSNAHDEVCEIRGRNQNEPLPCFRPLS